MGASQTSSVRNRLAEGEGGAVQRAPRVIGRRAGPGCRSQRDRGDGGALRGSAGPEWGNWEWAERVGGGNRDGNGEFPVGFCLPIPVPARSRFPRPRPREDSRGTFSSHPRPRGEYIPDGYPRPRNEITKKSTIQN